MKPWIAFLFTLVFTIPSCAPALPQKEKITLKLLNSFAAQQRSENNLRMIGVGGAMFYQVQEVSLHFTATKQLNLQQARRLYVEVVERLLAQINSNPEIRPYLKNYPFTPQNVSLLISFETETGKRVTPPFIALVGIANGCIFYDIHDREHDLLKDAHTEPYEEALNLVKQKSGF